MPCLDMMDDFVIIDEKSFILKCDKYSSCDFLDAEWSLKFDKDSQEATLTCSKEGGSNVWNIGATVEFKFVYGKEKKERIEKKEMEFTVRSTECDSRKKREYGEDGCSTVEAHVKVHSIVGLHYKTHDFTKKDIINNCAFVVGEETYYANKTILAMASPVFFAMFFTNFKESESEEIVIKDVEYHDDFKQFLRLIYGYEFSGESCTIEDILKLADRYDVQGVRIRCEQWMITKGIDYDLKEMLLYSEKYSLGLLQDYCIKHITKEQVKEFMKDERFGTVTIRRLAKKLVEYNKDCAC